MNKEVKFLIKIAKHAKKIITKDMQVQQKDNTGDLVTNFDLAIENYVCKQITKHFPKFSIVSEEFNSKNTLTENCFVLDPIDGTVNFAHKLPLWAIQIACIKNGKTCASVIYAPKLNELYYADDKKAYFNGKEIHVNNEPVEKNILLIEEIGKLKLKQSNGEINVSPKVRIIGCTALDFAWVACGKISATIFTRNTVWDYLPGLHLVEMAGGYIENKKDWHIALSNKKYISQIKKIKS